MGMVRGLCYPGHSPRNQVLHTQMLQLRMSRSARMLRLWSLLNKPNTAHAVMQREQHRNQRRGHDQEGTEDSKSGQDVQWLANQKSGSRFQA